MIVNEDFLSNNVSRNESSLVMSTQRCYFLDSLNNYEAGGLLYIESIVTTVINFIGAFIASFGNGIILLTFWKSKQLRSQSQLFLWCLAFADFVTGSVVQPFYGAYKIAYITGKVSTLCVFRVILETVAWFSAALSCALVAAIISERYLALHYHMRYHVVVTTKKVAILIAFLLVNMAILSLSRFAMTDVTPFFYVNIAGILFSLSTLIICYWKIYKHVRRHFRQIQDYGSRESKRKDVQRLKKSSRNMAYVALLYIISYMPFTCVLCVYLSCGFTSSVEVAYDVTRTVAFMNSSWNPFIYFWKLKELREAVKKLMRYTS